MERISDVDMENPLIQFSVHIEGYLTTGRYNKIQEYMQLLPHPLFSYLMAGLVESIRDDIESCIEESYRELSVEDFCRAVNWKRSLEEVLCHIEEAHGNWVVRDGVIVFPRRVASEKKERMETLGDLIKQINDIETIWSVCWAE